MHSAPCTNASTCIEVPAAIAASSSLVHSRAATTRENPIDSSRRAPSALWTTICVEACSGILGAQRRRIAASPASCTITASTPAAQAASAARMSCGISCSSTTILSVRYTLTPRTWHRRTVSAKCSSVKFSALRRALSTSTPKYTASAPQSSAASSAAGLPAGASTSGWPARALISPPALSGPLSRARQAGGADGRFHA